MAVVEPVAENDPAAEGLGRLMATYASLGDDDAIFPRILAHAPGYAVAIGDAMTRAHLDGGVDVRLKELMRIQLATTAGDTYFSTLRAPAAIDAGLTEDDVAAALGDFAASERFTEAEKWALRYAWLMYREPDKVDAAFYEEGKRHFSEAQIMELGGLIAVHYGMAVFMSTLRGRVAVPSSD